MFKVSGESAGVDKNIVNNFKGRLNNIIGDYTPKDIFICNKTSLFGLCERRKSFERQIDSAILL